MKLSTPIKTNAILMDVLGLGTLVYELRNIAHESAYERKGYTKVIVSKANFNRLCEYAERAVMAGHPVGSPVREAKVKGIKLFGLLVLPFKETMILALTEREEIYECQQPSQPQ